LLILYRKIIVVCENLIKAHEYIVSRKHGSFFTAEGGARIAAKVGKMVEIAFKQKKLQKYMRSSYATYIHTATKFTPALVFLGVQAKRRGRMPVLLHCIQKVRDENPGSETGYPDKRVCVVLSVV
jgi:hypothetical protein